MFDLPSFIRQLLRLPALRLRPLDERLRFAELPPAEERFFWLLDRLPEDRDAEELRRFWPPDGRRELVDPDWPDPLPRPKLELTFSVISLGSNSSSFTLPTAPDKPRTTQGPTTAASAPATPTATGT
jgi:hypothetical protein